MYINKMGIELEGAWKGTKGVEPFTSGTRIKHDGSVHFSQPLVGTFLHYGEVVSEPLEPEELKEWAREHCPTRINSSCGTGVRVLDLALFLPGPHLSQIMADHGAEVIKLEPPGEGDPGRHIGLGEHGHSVFFRNLNRGKQSVSLNLKSAAGREAILRIAAQEDVFIEAFRPGVAAKLGFVYETVRKRNPRVIYVSLTAFGQTGPYRDVPAHNLACEALAGTVSVNLGQDGQPTMPHVPVSDFAAASMGLAGVLMALYRREKTGAGDRLDISMHDAALAWLANVLEPVFVEKRAPVPQQERTWGGSAFYRIYRTSDGRHVVLGGHELKFVRNLLDAWGRPDLFALCERGPGPHQLPVIDFLQGVFATKTQAEWVEWFRGRDICGHVPLRDFQGKGNQGPLRGGIQRHEVLGG